MTFFPDPRSGIHIPSFPNILPCRQEQQESRKPKKPEMEKKRRNRMNTAIDWQKDFLVKYNEASSSKLEKADILEKSVELMKKFESALINNSAIFANCLIEQLVKMKTPAETMKTVVEALKTMPTPFPKGQQNNLRMTQNAMPAPPSGRPPMMPPAQFVYPPPSHPSAFMFNQNILLAQQQLMNTIRIGNPIMTSTPKAPSNSAPPHSSSSTPVLNSKTSTSSITDSRPPSADDFSSEEEEIDIENVDENDNTYSPPTTPSNSPRRGSKRSSSSMATDDSGIERSPKRCKNSFFIDGLLKNGNS